MRQADVLIQVVHSQEGPLLSGAVHRGDVLDLSEFQQLMKQLYFKRDYERGVLKTALWLIEEIGELARAIVRDGNYEEELADIVAWTTSLANILNVDLVTAINKKYCHCLSLLTNFAITQS